MNWNKETNSLYINLPEIQQLNTNNSNNTINVFVNNEKIVFQQQPIVLNNTLFIPLRPVMEKLNYKIEWNERSKLITLSKIS